MDTQKVWVDAVRCTGCGVCVPLCPTGAITLAEGKARVDETACTGCGACVEVCPTGAMHLVEGKATVNPDLCRECEVCLNACPAGAIVSVTEPVPGRDMVKTEPSHPTSGPGGPTVPCR